MNDQPCQCVICGAALPGRDAGIVSAVAEHGWCAVRIAGTVEFAYTVGLWHTFRLPELVMFGLHGEHMQQLLNGCVAHVRRHGWPEDAAPFSGVLEGFDTQLRPVDESWRDALFGTAHRFYRGWSVPVSQLVWPDAAGRWPWHEQATPSSRTRQAFAWMPVGEHPAGGWRLLGEFAGEFPLPGEPDSWALTTRSILDGVTGPTTVLFDDDAFDVLDGRGHDAEDLCVTYLGNLVLRRPSLRQLGDLPNGTAAVTDGNGAWHRSTMSEQQRESSIAGWDRGQQNTAY